MHLLLLSEEVTDGGKGPEDASNEGNKEPTFDSYKREAIQKEVKLKIGEVGPLTASAVEDFLERVAADHRTEYKKVTCFSNSQFHPLGRKMVPHKIGYHT